MNDGEPKVIGIVGGIGSGKSAVAAAFAEHGAHIINADKIGHEALEQTEIKADLIKRWGDGICAESGKINRRELGKIVFADDAERKALESLVFPYIGQRIKQEISLARGNKSISWIVLDAAIMLETGWSERCDWIIYVHAPATSRKLRLLEQRGWNEKEVQQRTRAQMSLTEKVTHADFVIDNSRDVNHLERRVKQLLATLESADTRSI